MFSNYEKNIKEIGRQGRREKVLAELGYKIVNFERVKKANPTFTFKQITNILNQEKSATAHKARENAAARKEHKNEQIRLWNTYRTELNAKNAEHKRALNAKNAELKALRNQISRLKNSSKENEARRRIAEREKQAAEYERIKLRERYN